MRFNFNCLNGIMLFAATHTYIVAVIFIMFAVSGVLEERGGGGGRGPCPPIRSGQGAKKGHIFLGLIWPIRY